MQNSASSYPTTNPVFLNFDSRRSVVFGSKGLVSATQPIAVQCGLEILRKGGNAADAAVATAAGLNLTEPCSCGIGGDVFCLFWNAKEKTLKGLNGSGRSPKALTLEKARELGIKGQEIGMKNANSVTVPGTCLGWIDTVKLFGSGKLTMSDILEPAIRLAEEGAPISELTSLIWNKGTRPLLSQSPNGGEMLIPDEKAPGGYRSPKTGELFTNVNLAKTFKTVAEQGREGYYEGRIAEEIVKVITDLGGVMTLEDLSSHRSTPTEPISYTYHHTLSSVQGAPLTLHEHAPNGQGLTALIALGILDQMQEIGKIENLSKLEQNGVEWLHALIEAMRLAFADAKAYIADPEKFQVPVNQLLSKEYLRTRAELFDPNEAKADVRKGSPISSSDTVYFTTADAEGNACSFIMSNYGGFGTCIVPKGCGFTLQNRGSGFVLKEGHPNCLDGGKRPYHTIIPAMVTKNDGDLFMAYGVMGGYMQPQGHVQVLLNMLHHGYNPQNALDAPRFCISAGPAVEPGAAQVHYDSNNENINSEVFLEDGIKPEVVEKLKAMGHDVKVLTGESRAMFGRGQIIMKTVDERTGRTVWAAGSDPRGDGHAVGAI